MRPAPVLKWPATEALPLAPGRVRLGPPPRPVPGPSPQHSALPEPQHAVYHLWRALFSSVRRIMLCSPLGLLEPNEAANVCRCPLKTANLFGDRLRARTEMYSIHTSPEACSGLEVTLHRKQPGTPQRWANSKKDSWNATWSPLVFLPGGPIQSPPFPTELAEWAEPCGLIFLWVREAMSLKNRPRKTNLTGSETRPSPGRSPAGQRQEAQGGSPASRAQAAARGGPCGLS